jgi:hypothetical protein
MWMLIKSEIKYNGRIVFITALINIAFTVFGLLGINIFPSESFPGKYFWTIIVAVGSYFVIFIYWTIRTVEKRERLSALLPLTKKQLALIRYLLGVIPFLVIASWIELNRLILPPEYHKFIARISTQLSMLFIFLSLFAIGMELHFETPYKSRINKIIDSIILFNLTAASIALYTLEGFTYLPQMGVLEGRVYFYVWGLIVSSVAVRFFYKRISYSG